MFSKFVGLLRTLGGRILVAKDKTGNSYYRKPEKVGGVAEKRWVEFKGTPDPNSIPVEWTSWLSGTRKEAPTAQETINMEAQRKNMKMQAAHPGNQESGCLLELNDKTTWVLQKEEAKQRFRARVSQHGQNAESSQQEMEIIMRQIDSREFGSSQTEEPTHARYTKVRDVKESAEPTAWQPPGKNIRSTVPEKFNSGTWKP